MHCLAAGSVLGGVAGEEVWVVWLEDARQVTNTF